MVICDELGRAKIWGLKKGIQKFSKGEFSRGWNFATWQNGTLKNRLHSIWALIFAKAEFKVVLKFKVWQNGTLEILRLIYRIAKFSKRGLSGVWAEFGGFWLYKTRRTDYWMRNLWIFNARGFLLAALTLNLGLFYGSLRPFFAWLGFLCVELAFCGTAFVRRLLWGWRLGFGLPFWAFWLAVFWLLGFLPAFSLI